MIKTLKNNKFIINSKNHIEIYSRSENNYGEVLWRRLIDFDDFEKIMVKSEMAFSAEVEMSCGYTFAGDYIHMVKNKPSLKDSCDDSIIKTIDCLDCDEFLEICEFFIDAFNEYKINQMMIQFMMNNPIASEEEALKVCSNLFFKSNCKKEEAVEHILFLQRSVKSVLYNYKL